MSDPDVVLTHDLDGDPFTCQSCANDADANAHTLYDMLAGPLAADPDGAWPALVADRARVAVAERQDAELYCWCGHTLHYPDCACDAGLSCARRYALELPARTADEARARFACPGETMEHWPESVDGPEYGQGDWLVTCGACGAEAWVRGALEPDPDDRPGDHGGDDPGYRQHMQDAGRGALLP
jgi:hypothetical protein